MKIAIYSRKSKFTSKGDSIENQIQLCREYAEKHYDNPEYMIYEDEGFSGGNVDRPRFQRMLHDAKGKNFDTLICYRLDRVSRNIADFSSLIEELQEHGISFVSIREQFDTSTPMGRAIMFIASVFAQLERETIAERVRDNMLELAKTGRWLGGVPPLGFTLKRITLNDSENKERSLVELCPVEEELKKVEFIYNKYLELGSIHQVRKYLIQHNIKTKNNAYFASRKLSDILRNSAYVKANKEIVRYLEDKGVSVAGQDRINGSRAILIYNKKDKRGFKNSFDEWIGAVTKHEGYIPSDKWLQVQHQLDRNSMKLPRVGTSEVALLSGLLRCEKCGSTMNVTYGRKRKDGTISHYYTCNMKTISQQEKCQNPNANGIDIDYTVVSKLTELATANKETLHEELEALRSEKKQISRVNVLDELKNKKEHLVFEINNLVGELSKSAAASKYILPQIEAKDKEVKKLDEEIDRLEKEKKDENKKAEGFEIIINNILNFASVIDKLSNREKKAFLQTIIDKVFWDGEAGQVAIQLLNDLSHFHTAPSCERNETGIILYQEMSSSHRYENLPEDTLGQRIRKQRFLKGLTAKELGNLCALAESTIYYCESGYSLSPSTIKKILQVLDTQKK